MRGDQLARSRMNRAGEVNSNGVTETERAEQKETAPRTIYLDLETLQKEDFPLYTERVERANRRVLIRTVKFKLSAPLRPLYKLQYCKPDPRLSAKATTDHFGKFPPCGRPFNEWKLTSLFFFSSHRFSHRDFRLLRMVSGSTACKAAMAS
jgi:hypothetical protein